MGCLKLYTCDLCDEVKDCLIKKDEHEEWLHTTRLRNIKNIVIVTSEIPNHESIVSSIVLSSVLSDYGAKTALFEFSHINPQMEFFLGRPSGSKVLEFLSDGLEPVNSSLGFNYVTTSFFVEEPKALPWQDEEVMSLIKNIFLNTHWGELDYLVIYFPSFYMSFLPRLKEYFDNKLEYSVFIGDLIYPRTIMSEAYLRYISEHTNILCVLYPFQEQKIVSKISNQRCFSIPFIEDLNAKFLLQQVLPDLKTSHSDVLKEVAQSCLEIFSK